MKTVRYVYWQVHAAWPGYLEDFPDCQTQGESLEELQENLRDIHRDLADGAIPGVKHIGELQIT